MEPHSSPAFSFISAQHSPADLSISLTTFSISSFIGLSLSVVLGHLWPGDLARVSWSHDILRRGRTAGNRVAIGLNACRRSQPPVDPVIGHKSSQDVADSRLKFGGQIHGWSGFLRRRPFESSA